MAMSLCTFDVPYCNWRCVPEEVSLHLFTEENSWDFKDKQPPTPCLSGSKPVKMNGDRSLLDSPPTALSLSDPPCSIKRTPASSSPSLPLTFGRRQIRLGLILSEIFRAHVPPLPRSSLRVPVTLDLKGFHFLQIYCHLLISFL